VSKLEELCDYVRRLGEVQGLVNRLNAQISHFENFRDKYLSPDRFPSIVPREVLRVTNSPGEIYSLFSEEFQSEVRSLAYVLPLAQDPDTLLRGIADCLYQIKEGESRA
ncbi:MAG: hypothetical protein ABWK01_06830, partial [Infirmifilum sp.]